MFTSAMVDIAKNHLTVQQKNSVAQYLFHNTKVGKLKRGGIVDVAAHFGLNRKSVSRIWMQVSEQMEEGLPINLRDRSLGVPRKPNLQMDEEKLKGIELQQRGTVTGLADGLEVSSSTAWRWVKDGQIRSHTNAIKPTLTADCMFARFIFCVNAINCHRAQSKWVFKCMKHVVHIDEKWFFLTKTSQNYYLHPDEPDPYRTCKSKKFITKVMFMCAVSRPIYNCDGSLIFYGKIGMFPFTEKVAAKRSSKRRRAGTLETKAIDSINKEVIKSCMLNKVLPAIKANWPLTESTDIIIQQDNARPHIEDSDMDLRSAASSDGFNIHLVCQPTNSPDLNILDLGWFRALQALQTKIRCMDIDQLVDAIMLAFIELHPTKLNNVFLSLQNCIVEILKVKGSNNYRVPHMNKAGLARIGELPENLNVAEELVRECFQYLVEKDEAVGYGWMLQDIGFNGGIQ